MSTWLLFRTHTDHAEEYAAAQQIWGERVVRFRTQIPAGARVAGRYSVLPHYAELDEELRLRSAHLLNDTAEHAFVADMRRWYPVLSAWTPRTWFGKGWASVPECPRGYVVKGTTNSRKFEWTRRMFAPDRAALAEVTRSLREDALISEQGLVIREFVPLAPVLDIDGAPEFGLNGLPLSQEWRFFFVGTTLVAGGFYGSIAENARAYTDIPDEAMALARSAAALLAEHVTFYSLDVARTANGGWLIIEINEGAMSGLSEIDPIDFYRGLHAATIDSASETSS